MASHPRPTDSISAPATQRNLRQRKLRAAEVLPLGVATLWDTLSLRMAPNARYGKESVLAVPMHRDAAANASSIEDAAQSLPDAPHPHTVRLTRRGMTVQTIEQQINQSLLNRQLRRLLQRPLPVACDLKEVPDWGAPNPKEKEFVWKGRSRCIGTRRHKVLCLRHLVCHQKRAAVDHRRARLSQKGRAVGGVEVAFAAI